jgi:D-3-phosphoglycerate dehydrogenase
MKLLVATEKPFHPDAVNQIKDIAQKAGYEFALLEKYADKADLIEAVKSAEALIVRSDKITSEVIDKAEKLKIIVRAGAGFDNVDTEAAAKKDITVMNTPGQNSNAVAELALGMMVFLARGKFNGKPGTELKGKSLGIHAYGNVGVNVARIAKGFGMEVYAFDAYVDKESIENDGVKALNSAEELYSKCQYISLHIPANEQTKNSINYKLLSSMPENGVLVNTARKEVIHEGDLEKVLNDRTDFRYISDIAPDNKDILEKEFADRIFFTPKKMGAQTAEANINAGVAAAQQIVNYIEKGDTTFKVN